MKKIVLLVIRKTVMFLIVVFLVVGFESCGSGRPIYPKEWSPIVKNPPLQSFAGQYNVMLMRVLKSESYSKENLNNCMTDFWITDKLEVMFRSKCKGDTLSRSDFSLISPSYKIVIKKEKDGVLINYQDQNVHGGDITLGPRGEYVFLTMAQDGSLVVKKGEWFYGVALFIPVAYDNYEWYRFLGDKVEIRNGKN